LGCKPWDKVLTRAPRRPKSSRTTAGPRRARLRGWSGAHQAGKWLAPARRAAKPMAVANAKERIANHLRTSQYTLACRVTNMTRAPVRPEKPTLCLVACKDCAKWVPTQKDSTESRVGARIRKADDDRLGGRDIGLPLFSWFSAHCLSSVPRPCDPCSPTIVNVRRVVHFPRAASVAPPAHRNKRTFRQPLLGPAPLAARRGACRSAHGTHAARRIPRNAGFSEVAGA
jgi:hypothetical protein